jgi:hypothetical protein
MRRCPTYLEFEIDFLLGNKEILILAADIHGSVIVGHQGEIAPQVAQSLARETASPKRQPSGHPDPAD